MSSVQSKPLPTVVTWVESTSFGPLLLLPTTNKNCRVKPFLIKTCKVQTYNCFFIEDEKLPGRVGAVAGEFVSAGDAPLPLFIFDCTTETSIRIHGHEPITSESCMNE